MSWHQGKTKWLHDPANAREIDRSVTQSEKQARKAMAKGSEALAAAMGAYWPGCGHFRRPETTHRVGSVVMCKTCRRKRWNKNVANIIARRESWRANRMKGGAVCIAKRQAILEAAVHPSNGRFPLDVLQHHIARDFGITRAQLVGKRGSKTHRNARAVLVRILRERGLSFPQIGKLMGGRDHSTAIYSLGKFDDYTRDDSRVIDTYLRLRDKEPLAALEAGDAANAA